MKPKKPKKPKPIKVGDYVLASLWGDYSPDSPCAVGFVEEITTNENASFTYYKLSDNKRHYRHATEITKKQGHLICQKMKEIEESCHGLFLQNPKKGWLDFYLNLKE